MLTCLNSCLLMPIATSPWVNRGFLGFTHLLSTAGIAMATYGGSPSASGSVANPMLDKVGNCIILCTILILIGWLVILGRRIAGRGDHPYARPTKTMFYTACAGVPFQSLRSAYATTYAFTGIRSLDPFTGSFATRLVLMFMFELAVTLIATVGGWMTRHINDEKEIDQQPYTLDLVDTVE